MKTPKASITLSREHCVLLFNIVLVVLARLVRLEKEIRDIPIVKEEAKLFMFEDDMVLCTEKPKCSTKKLRIDNSKVAEAK
jgi:hypothetical protein